VTCDNWISFCALIIRRKRTGFLSLFKNCGINQQPPRFLLVLPHYAQNMHSRNTTLSSIDEKLAIDSHLTSSPIAENTQYPGFRNTTSPSGDDVSSTSEYDEPTVPPNHQHRTLILCFDGTGKVSYTMSNFVTNLKPTGDQFDDDVWAFFYALSYDY